MVCAWKVTSFGSAITDDLRKSHRPSHTRPAASCLTGPAAGELFFPLIRFAFDFLRGRKRRMACNILTYFRVLLHCVGRTWPERLKDVGRTAQKRVGGGGAEKPCRSTVDENRFYAARLGPSVVGTRPVGTRRSRARVNQFSKLATRSHEQLNYASRLRGSTKWGLRRGKKPKIRVRVFRADRFRNFDVCAEWRKKFANGSEENPCENLHVRATFSDTPRRISDNAR